MAMSRERSTPGSLVRGGLWIALVIVGFLCIGSTWGGEEERASRELQGAQKQVEDLLAQAEKLAGEGRSEEAAALRQKARRPPARIQAASVRRRPSRKLNRDDFREVLKGLEQGMLALRTLGLNEESEKLQRIANRVRNALRSQEGSERGESERAAVRRQLEMLRLALPVLREEERGDAIELLERAIRARAPKRRQLVEILTVASELWVKYKNEEKAMAVDRLAKQLAGRGERRAPERREGGERELRRGAVERGEEGN